MTVVLHANRLRNVVLKCIEDGVARRMLVYRAQSIARSWIPAPGTFEGDRICRDFQKIEPRQACWRTRTNGSRVSLFDRNGLMLIDTRLGGD
jgi:hypothetical protein